MSTIVYPAARRMAADTAGYTGTPQPNPGAPSSVTPVELVSQIPTAAGDLGHMLAGGLHVENLVPVPVSTAEARATDSIRGAYGGLKARATSTVGPGPAGAAAAARSTLQKLRATLGI
jgi:hypothetical protein